MLGADNVGRLGQIWSTDVGAVVAASPVLASDVSVDGTALDLLYVATAHGDLYALDAATGRVVWLRNLGSQVTACSDMPGAEPGGGGIWGWGGASVDSSGDLYVATGNATTTPENYGYAERVVRLSSALEVQASNYPGLDGYDVDFGSTPVPYQAPGCPEQIVVENKSGVVFVYQRDAIASGPTQQVEIGDYALTSPLVGVPAYDATTRTGYASNSP